MTTAKKGITRSEQGVVQEASLPNFMTAKHLEPLKGGKIPVEILVTTKDQEEKTKLFEKCVDIIKSAGVCFLSCPGIKMAMRVVR